MSRPNAAILLSMAALSVCALLAMRGNLLGRKSDKVAEKLQANELSEGQDAVNAAAVNLHDDAIARQARRSGAPTQEGLREIERPAEVAAERTHSTAEGEVDSGTDPIGRLMLPWRVEKADQELATLRNTGARVGKRLDAAHYLMAQSIALHMECAGTAKAGLGKDEVLTTKNPYGNAPVQFSMDSRVYCFHAGEFAAWDTWKGYMTDPKELEAAKNGSGIDTFFDAVGYIGDDLLISLRSR